jgi:hypothetical protein
MGTPDEQAGDLEPLARSLFERVHAAHVRFSRR